MKRMLLVLAAGLLILAACAPSQTATTTGPSVDEIVSATISALTASAPTAPAATETTTIGTRVSLENVSFIIPQGLALGANGEIVPDTTQEDTSPWEVAPEHIHFTFYGYNNQLAQFSVMEISVYPAQPFADANNGAAISLPRLQNILSNPSAPIDTNNLPGVPYFNAGQMVAAQAKVINFASGSGVRVITQYGQAAGPVTNNGTFYQFQGLTSDGKYYVIVIMPIGAPYLPNPNQQYDPNNVNAGLPAGGIPFPGYTSIDPKDYESYYQAVADKMNTTDPGVFSPALTMLDALIQSITITSQ